MNKFRIASVAACVLAGIALSISQCLQHHWLSAFNYFACGIIAGGFCITFDMTYFQHPPIAAVCGLLTFSCFTAVFLEHRAFNAPIGSDHDALVQVFGKLQHDCIVPGTDTGEIGDKGVYACTLQNSQDQVSSVASLAKAEHWGPGASLVDGVQSLKKKTT